MFLTVAGHLLQRNSSPEVTQKDETSRNGWNTSFRAILHLRYEQQASEHRAALSVFQGHV